MSTEPKKEESDKTSAEDIEVKTVPEGTFGGTKEKPVRIQASEKPMQRIAIDTYLGMAWQSDRDRADAGRPRAKFSPAAELFTTSLRLATQGRFAPL
jgi:hypothetical protein